MGSAIMDGLTIEATARKEKAFEVLGNRVSIEVDGEETDGRFSVVEYGVAPVFAGPPLHRHPFDEVFHVLDGALAIRQGDQAFRAAAGTTVFIPAGMAHTFANPDSRPARFLGIASPAGFERYFVELAARLARGEDYLEIVRKLGPRYGMEVVAPGH